MRRLTRCRLCQERFNPFGQRLLGIDLELLGQTQIDARSRDDLQPVPDSR